LRSKQYAELFAMEGQPPAARMSNGSRPQRDGGGGRVVADGTLDELLLREPYADPVATEGQPPVSRAGRGSTRQRVA